MIEHVDMSGLPNTLQLSFILYDRREATATINNREKGNGNNHKKKLTKVLSTKLSTEDYERFEKLTYFAYKAKMIEEPETSKFLRYIVTCPFKELGLSSQVDKQDAKFIMRRETK